MSHVQISGVQYSDGCCIQLPTFKPDLRAQCFLVTAMMVSRRHRSEFFCKELRCFRRRRVGSRKEERTGEHP